MEHLNIQTFKRFAISGTAQGNPSVNCANMSIINNSRFNNLVLLSALAILTDVLLAFSLPKHPGNILTQKIANVTRELINIRVTGIKIA